MSAEPEAPKDATLLPCPFCGELPVTDDDFIVTVECSNLDCAVTVVASSIAAWNRRAGIPAAAPATETIDLMVVLKNSLAKDALVDAFMRVTDAWELTLPTDSKERAILRNELRAELGTVIDSRGRATP